MVVRRRFFDFPYLVVNYSRTTLPCIQIKKGLVLLLLVLLLLRHICAETWTFRYLLDL